MRWCPDLFKGLPLTNFQLAERTQKISNKFNLLPQYERFGGEGLTFRQLPNQDIKKMKINQFKTLVQKKTERAAFIYRCKKQQKGQKC